jgi:hypothetical protein
LRRKKRFGKGDIEMSEEVERKHVSQLISTDTDEHKDKSGANNQCQ